MMSRQRLYLFILGSIALVGFTGFVGAEKEEYAVEGGRIIHPPVTHENLSVFIITGKDTLGDNMDYVTLDEAMKKKWVVVHETGRVNQLTVENVTSNRTVVILAGAVVKGGKQDRVLRQEMVLKPNSGKVPIASFCVERSRWARRGSESLMAFSANSAQVSGKELRKAVKSGLGQGRVWKEVEREQMRISRSLNEDIRAVVSPSSYLLALENTSLKKEIDTYKKVLAPIIDKHPDAIGYALTINGEFSTADVYASRKLFSKTWSQHLESAITEAVSLKSMAKKDQKIDLSWRDDLFKDGSYQRKTVQRTGGANYYIGEQNLNFFRYNSLLKTSNERDALLNEVNETNAKLNDIAREMSLHMSFEKRATGESLDQSPSNPRNQPGNQQNIAPLPANGPQTLQEVFESIRQREEPRRR